MRVVVAHRAVHLGGQLDRLDGRHGALQAVGDVGKLLAQRGGAGRLAVGARQHGLLSQLGGEIEQPTQHAPQQRHDDFTPRAREHQAMRGVVDVFRGAGEVEELGVPVHVGHLGRLRLEPVLHRLDVVVGGALDGLDFGGLRAAEAGNQVAQRVAGRWRQGGELCKAQIGQADVPGHFNLDAAAHQPSLGQMRAQGVDLGGIAPIQGRKGVQSGQRGGLRCGVRAHAVIVERRRSHLRAPRAGLRPAPPWASGKLGAALRFLVRAR